MQKKQSYRKLSGAEKLRILEEGRQEGITLTQVCRKYGITLSQFYSWEKKAREAMQEALSSKPSGRKSVDKTSEYQEEIKRLKNAIVEISLSNMELKKTLLD